MTLQQVINAGKQFRRSGGEIWYPDSVDMGARLTLLSYADILAMDWESKEDETIVSMSDFIAAADALSHGTSVTDVWNNLMDGE